jgi:hypothetical protein
MRMHLNDFHDFHFPSFNHIHGTPLFIQVYGPLSGAVPLERMIMPTSHSSNFFQTILLNIINPLLKLNNQSFRRLYQVFFDWSDIDLIDHRFIVLPKGVPGQTFSQSIPPAGDFGGNHLPLLRQQLEFFAMARTNERKITAIGREDPGNFKALRDGNHRRIDEADPRVLVSAEKLQSAL